MKEKISGWAFGILSSIFSMILFYDSRLYAQSTISLYYTFIGIYGWVYWYKAKQKDEHIKVWNWKMHIIACLCFTFLSLTAAWFFKHYTNSGSPYLDSFITLFGFLASIKEARKILSSWVYWFVLNFLSCWLYYSSHLYFYSVMMVIYSGICIPGYLNWKKIYLEHTKST